MKSSIVVWSSLLVFLGCGSAARSEAEETADARESGIAAEVSKAALEEVTVTARKRVERLQDAPISVSVFNANSIAERGIDSVSEVGSFAPNVKFNSAVPISASNATAAIYVRGIGQNDYQLSADPGVGLYLDGVYISRGVGNVLDVLNIERIEILRGPQGTLFGRNTIGGAVNVITKKPGDRFAGEFDATTGTGNRIQLKTSIDIPLSDSVRVNLAGFRHKRDGYVHGVTSGAPTLGDTNAEATRGTLRWIASDSLTIDVAVDGSRSREESAPNVAIAIDENAPAPRVWNTVYSGAPGICANPTDPTRLHDTRCYNSQWVLGPYAHGGTFVDRTLPQFDAFGGKRYESASDTDIWGASTVADWQLGGSVSLKSITAYRKVTGFWTRDSDHSPANIVQTKNIWTQHEVSEELQLQGTSVAKRLKWIVGGYHADETGNHKDVVQIIDAAFLSGAILGAESVAAFGQATYDITNALSATAGVRWTRDSKRFGNDNQYVIAAGFLTGAPLNPDGSGLRDGNPLMGPLGTQAKIENSAWTPMATLSYRWTPSVLTYVSYSEGFKGGGFTQRVFPPFPGIPSFKPEFSKTYEIGIKSDLADNRVRLNAAVFRNAYSDLQLTVNDPTLGFAPIIQNAAKSRIQGAELELQARPIEALRLEAGVGYLDAKYTEVDIRALNSGVTPNTRLQNAPKWTASAGISYKLMLPKSAALTPRVDWSYRSKVFNDAVNTPLLVQDGYHLVNANVTYTSADARWTVAGGVKNLTDKAYLVAGYADAFAGEVEGVFGRPREWYADLNYAF